MARKKPLFPESQRVEPQVRCAHPGCETPAISRIKIGHNQFVNVCFGHDAWAGEKRLDYLLSLATV